MKFEWSKLVNPLKHGFNWLYQLLIFLAAIFIMPFIHAAKVLEQHTYTGWYGKFRIFIGLLISFSTATYTAYYTGWSLNWAIYQWLPTSFLSAYLSYTYAWPLVWTFILQWLFKWGNTGWTLVTQFAQNRIYRLSRNIIERISYALPGSSMLWEQILDTNENSILNKLLVGLSYPVSLLASCFLAWGIYAWLLSLLGSIPVFGLAFSICLASFVAIASTCILWQFVAYGRLPFVALAFTFGIVSGYSPQLFMLASLFDTSLVWAVLIHALTLLVFITYVFPLVNIALSGSIIQWYMTVLKPFLETAYDDPDRPYGLFFRHLINLVASAIAFYISFNFCTSISLPIWATAPIVCTVVLASYLCVFELIDHGGGFIYTSILLSLYTGWKVFITYTFGGYAGGLWTSVPLTFFSIILVFTAIFPLSYLGLKFIFKLTKIANLANKISALHSSVLAGFVRFKRWLSSSYDKCYYDESKFQQCFLHIANLAISYFISYKLAFWIATLFGSQDYLVLGIACSAAILSYILIGKFLLESDIGNQIVSSIPSILVAIIMVLKIRAANASLLASILVGISTATASYYVIFPRLYLTIAWILSPISGLTNLLHKTLTIIHDLSWQWFIYVWNPLEEAWSWLSQLIVEPITVWLKAHLKKLNQAYQKLLLWIR